MATIKHEENIVRIPVKVVSYQQELDTAFIHVKDRFGSKYELSFNRKKYDIDWYVLLKRSRYLKKIESKVELEQLYGYVVGFVIDNRLICRAVPEEYQQELKGRIAKLDGKYQELEQSLDDFIKSFPADFNAQTECYKITNMWLRIWARALVANNKLPAAHLALQIKFLEAVDIAYSENKYSFDLHLSSVWWTSYLLHSDDGEFDEFNEYAKPDSIYKQWLGLCGIKPDSRLLFDYLDSIARKVRSVLAQDIENLERNRRQTGGFFSVWNTNSDEDEYRFQYRNLSLWRTVNFLFPAAVTEAEMGRFLTETAKF